MSSLLDFFLQKNQCLSMDHDNQQLFCYISHLIKRPIVRGRSSVGISHKKRFAPVNELQTISKHLIEEFNPRRVGIIPYTIRRGGPYFCLGRDRRYQSLTDFGGGLKRSDVTPIKGALREFDEETLGAFGDISDYIKSALAVFDKSMLILFVRIDCNPLLINTKFSRKLRITHKPEVDNLLWLTSSQFKDLVMSRKGNLYDRVRNCLSRARGFWMHLRI